MRIKVRNPFTKATELMYERNQLRTEKFCLRLTRPGCRPWCQHTSSPASKGDLSLIMILKCPPFGGDSQC